MIGDSAPSSLRKGNALLAIAVGGLIAGTLDLTQACILFGWKIPLAIAAGLLERVYAPAAFVLNRTFTIESLPFSKPKRKSRA
jgi:hypothetical protein